MKDDSTCVSCEYRPGAEGQRSSVVLWQVRRRLAGLQIQILKYVNFAFNADLHTGKKG